MNKEHSIKDITPLARHMSRTILSERNHHHKPEIVANGLENHERHNHGHNDNKILVSIWL
jgi:hypothetical protein